MGTPGVRSVQDASQSEGQGVMLPPFCDRSCYPFSLFCLSNFCNTAVFPLLVMEMRLASI